MSLERFRRLQGRPPFLAGFALVDAGSGDGVLVIGTSALSGATGALC